MYTKIQISWQTLVCFAVFVVSTWYYVGNAVVCLEPNQFGYDFQLRYNETKCVLAGYDPFLIWIGQQELLPYLSFDKATSMVDGCHEYVGAYPPWEYPLMMPLALLPKRLALCAFFMLGVLCSLALVVWSVFAGWKLRGKLADGFLCGAVAVMPVYYVVYCLNYLNFGILIALDAVVLAYCLDRNRQIFAGVCWAMMMLKPQIAMLFAIPLLIGKRFRAICVATGICILLSVVSAIMCGRSPIEMIFAVGRCREMFPKCYLLGPVVTEWLLGFSSVLPLALNAAIGVVVCFVLSWRFRKSDAWLVKLLPALTLCWLWSVSRFYDQSVLVVSFVAVALWLLRVHNSQWGLWFVLGALTSRALVLYTNSVVLSCLSLSAVIGSFAVLAVAKSHMAIEAGAALAIVFALVSLFPNISEDVAFPILVLLLLSFHFARSRLEVFLLVIGAIFICMIVEMSQWACYPVSYFLEFALLYFCARNGLWHVHVIGSHIRLPNGIISAEKMSVR